MKITVRDAPPRSVWALQQAGVHPLLAQLFAARGVLGPEELDDGLARLLPPSALHGAQEAAVLLADTMAAFAIAAGILKTLGIVRWLTTMPMLANLYVGTPDPAIRTMIELNYMTLNAYAGGVGELLGVQLISGLWLILLGLVFRKLGLTINAIISTLLGIAFALTALRTVVPEVNALSATVQPFALVWLVALAVTFWRRASGSTA